MMIKTKSLRRMIVLLVFVLLLTLLMQMSRSELVMRWNGDNDGTGPRAAARNALAPAELARIHQERLVVLVDPDDATSQKVAYQAEQVLTGMKKRFERVPVGSVMPDPAPDGVIVTVSDLTRLAGTEWLDGYVARGGRVLLAIEPENNEAFSAMYRRLDILEIGTYVETSDIRLHTNVLLGFAGGEFRDPGLHISVLRVKLGQHSRVHVSAGEHVPLLWEAPYGKGAYIVFNGALLQEKINRGLFAGAIGVLLPDLIYPVLNAKLMYIDDFPAPFPQGTHPLIDRDYRMDLPHFFKKVWWPDMIRLARKHDLKYTGALIVTYGNRVTPPFDWESDADVSSLVLYGRELLKEGGEIGVHGYNHQTLSTVPRVSRAFGYNMWPSQREMTVSLRSLRQYVESVFPHYPLRTYVPPSNALDEAGRQVLKQALPDLVNISSLYIEDIRNLSYVQEYKLAPDGVVEMPRVTYGYRIGEYDRWMMANAVTAYGIFSHFVHPDDVIDEVRGGNGSWRDLYTSLEEYLELVQDRYGWLRPMTAAEASGEARRWLESQPVFERRPGGLNGYINGFAGPQYFLLRTDRNIVRTKRCEVRRIEQGAYLVRADHEIFSIDWTEKP